RGEFRCGARSAAQTTAKDEEGSRAVSIASRLGSWPLVRQLSEGDPLGLGKSVRSKRSETLRARIDDADTVASSICPYCAVGCGQRVYVKGGEVVQIEGD